MKKILTIATTTLMAAALALPSFAQTAQAPAPVKDKAAKAVKAAKPAPNPAPTETEINDAKSKGLVWVNLNTKVYHAGGDFFGKTKSGKFMTQAEAEKAGYKAAKEPAAKSAKKHVAKAETAKK
jgi:hypothetical protein